MLCQYRVVTLQTGRPDRGPYIGCRASHLVR